MAETETTADDAAPAEGGEDAESLVAEFNRETGAAKPNAMPPAR